MKITVELVVNSVVEHCLDKEVRNPVFPRIWKDRKKRLPLLSRSWWDVFLIMRIREPDYFGAFPGRNAGGQPLRRLFVGLMCIAFCWKSLNSLPPCSELCGLSISLQTTCKEVIRVTVS